MNEERVTSETGGQKGSKLAQPSLIDPTFLHELAVHCGLGAIKYSRDNWRKGYDFSLSYDAMCRHLFEWWNGQDDDPELGTSHLAAVAFHAMVLFVNRDAISMETLPERFDNRPKGRYTLAEQTEVILMGQEVPSS